MDKSDTVFEIIGASLRSVSASIPIVASIATGWSEYKNYRQAEYIEDTMSKFGSQLDSIYDTANQEFVKSDQMKLLVEKTMNRAKDENSDVKRDMLAKFLASACTERLCDNNYHDAILEVVDRLSGFQAQILKIIAYKLVIGHGRDSTLLGANYNPDAEEKEVFKYITEKNIIDHYEGDKSQASIESNLAYMISLGVVETHSARGWTRVGGKEGIIGVRPTKLGLAVLEYLDSSIEKMLTVEELVERFNKLAKLSLNGKVDSRIDPQVHEALSLLKFNIDTGADKE